MKEGIDEPEMLTLIDIIDEKNFIAKDEILIMIVERMTNSDLDKLHNLIEKELKDIQENIEDLEYLDGY